MITRRSFISGVGKLGLAGATSQFFSNVVSQRAIAQASSTYKAVVVITLSGGNDGNNMVVPMDSPRFAEYTAIRGPLALAQSYLLPLQVRSGGAYGLNPALKNCASLFNAGRANIIANVGPLKAPASKQDLLNNSNLLPSCLLSHPIGVEQWESAQTSNAPSTGWGGRIADLLAGQSGSLPPVLNAGYNSIFTVGQNVQGVAIQANGVYPALTEMMNSAVLNMAEKDSSSANALVSHLASFRAQAMEEQLTLENAAAYGTLSTTFPDSAFGRSMQMIAQFINGRSVVGASRQIFYAQQGAYDTHDNQVSTQYDWLQDFDASIGAFFQEMDQIGLGNDVLLCTASDFARTMQPNGSAGSDHAWGSHQLVLGGTSSGGKLIGTLPDFELGGPSDLFTQGVWIPTQSVTQMAAGVGNWLGLNSAQLNSIFPDLSNFQTGFLPLA